MQLSRKNLEEAAQFANFAQRVKMEYWATITETEPGRTIKENQLDEILLLAWKDLQSFQKKGVKTNAK